MGDILNYRNHAVALAYGLLLGIERGCVQRGEAAVCRVAGLQTIGLLGALCGFVGLVAKIDHPFLAVILFGGASTLLVVGHASVAIKTSTVSATMVFAEMGQMK